MRELIRRSSESPSEVIRGHHRQSEVISGNQRSSEALGSHHRQSEVISGNQRSSEALGSHHRQSEVIRGNQRSSEALGSHHRQSVAISIRESMRPRRDVGLAVRIEVDRDQSVLVKHVDHMVRPARLRTPRGCNLGLTKRIATDVPNDHLAACRSVPLELRQEALA